MIPRRRCRAIAQSDSAESYAPYMDIGGGGQPCNPPGCRADRKASGLKAHTVAKPLNPTFDSGAAVGYHVEVVEEDALG